MTTSSSPLADRMRPRTLDELYGQEKLVGPNTPLRRLIEQDTIPSMIFWGPPGSGKTTLASLMASLTGSVFEQVSAVMAGVADLRRVVKEAKDRLEQKDHPRRTILFVDEIHRFSKSQQDALLPSVEQGIVTLIGATTENPSFEVNPALRSRARVFVLERLSDASLRVIIEQALHDKERGLGGQQGMIEAKAIDMLVVLADGDARQALTALELAFLSAPLDEQKIRRITVDHVREALQRAQFTYDKGGEEHYNVISALHKSMRGSDANAALYWLARMLEAGEEPLYVARRLIRFASEDIGVADPQALVQATTAYQAAHFLGMPESNVILAQAVVYLANAKKSNALYVGYKQAASDVHDLPNEPVPLHLRNAPTGLMKQLGYGKGYVYNPSVQGPVQQDYLPERLKGKRYL
jgi:putative ATPase